MKKKSAKTVKHDCSKSGCTYPALECMTYLGSEAVKRFMPSKYELVKKPKCTYCGKVFSEARYKREEYAKDWGR